MSCLHHNLSEHVSIFSGVPFRTRLEQNRNGKFVVIQARDITTPGDIIVESAARVDELPGSSPTFLEHLDVLLQPRGTRVAAGILLHPPPYTVAAAPLLILRPDPERLDAEFLVLYLQLPGTQAMLRNSAAGTHIPQIPRSAIANLAIAAPDLTAQQELVEYARMRRRETELTIRLETTREQLLELAVRELAAKGRRRQTAADPNSTAAGAVTPAES